MLRRLLVASLTAIVIAGCGSGSPTASPSASASAAASAAVEVTTAPANGPTAAPSAEVSTAGPTTMSAACAAVGIRKKPSTKGALLVRIAKGTSVRVAEVVPGNAYTAGTCGSDGDTWLKIDRIGGKSVKSAYGVAFGYAAAGYFK